MLLSKCLLKLLIVYYLLKVIITCVQFSPSVVSNCLWPHGLQHARPPCSSPTPRICSNSCPLSWWCHPTISSSVVPFSHLQSFSASGSFPVSQFFASGVPSIGVSASASGLLLNIQDWFPLGLTGWIDSFRFWYPVCLIKLQSKCCHDVFFKCDSYLSQ